MYSSSLWNDSRRTVVSLSLIDRTDTFFRLSPGSHAWTESLKQSIRRFGVICPLVVQEKTQSQYRLVDGFERLAITQELAIAHTPVLVVPDGVERQDMVRYRILSCSRALSLAERAQAVKMALACGFSHQQFCREIGIHVGIPTTGIVPLYRRLAGYPRDVLTYISAVGLSVKQALVLEGLTETEQRSIVVLAGTLSLKGFDLSTVAMHLKEIAAREDTTVEAVLQEIVSCTDSALVSPRPLPTTRSVKQQIHDRRYPLLANINNRLQQLRSEVEKPGRIKLQWDRQLEGGLFISFAVDAASDIEEALRYAHDQEWRKGLAEFTRVHYEGLPDKQSTD